MNQSGKSLVKCTTQVQVLAITLSLALFLTFAKVSIGYCIDQ